MRPAELNTANISRRPPLQSESTPLGAAVNKVEEIGSGVSATGEEVLRSREDECSDGEWLVSDQGEKPIQELQVVCLRSEVSFLPHSRFGCPEKN